jgi:hypothetical protein
LVDNLDQNSNNDKIVIFCIPGPCNFDNKKHFLISQNIKILYLQFVFHAEKIHLIIFRFHYGPPFFIISVPALSKMHHSYISREINHCSVIPDQFNHKHWNIGLEYIDFVNCKKMFLLIFWMNFLQKKTCCPTVAKS